MDTKLNTFLILCKLLNYTKTAQFLHLSQPAVTKQIQSLESAYNTKLFLYDGKKLKKTPECEMLEVYAQRIKYNFDEINKFFEKENSILIRIGATKSIGDYVLTEKIISFLKNPKFRLSLYVDNTENLLEMLDSSKLDFAVLEGYFDKSRYSYKLLKNEPFIGVCSKYHKFAGKTIDIHEIINESLIVREKGSGTRNILERELNYVGYNLEMFPKLTTVSSFKLIIDLIKENLGLSFMYNSVIKSDENLSSFKIKNFKQSHAFNIVYLKSTNSKKYIDMFFSPDLLNF